MAIFLKSIETLPYNALLLTREIDKKVFLDSAHKLHHFVYQKFINAKDYRARISSDYFLFMKTEFAIDPFYAAKIKPFLDYASSGVADRYEKLGYLLKIRERLIAEGKYTEPNPMVFDNRLVFSVNLDCYEPLLEKYHIRRLTTFLPTPSSVVLKECLDKETEIRSVLETIANLIASGININNIKIINAHEYDRQRLQIEAQGFGFSLIDHSQRKLIEFPLTLTVLKRMEAESLKLILETIKAKIDPSSSIDSRVFSALMGIINDYGFDVLDENHDIFHYETEVRSINADSLIDGVGLINIEDVLPDENNHYLLINYIDSDFPAFKKDDDYLSDTEKRVLGLRTSIEENDLIRFETETIINGIPNLTLFYAKRSQNGEQHPSDLVIDRIVNKEIVFTKANSVSFAKENDYRLYAKFRLKREKFGVTTPDFSLLHATFSAFWHPYQARFSGIDAQTMTKLMEKQITISATSLTVFRQCHFRFLLQYILHLGQYEQSLELSLGNLAHYVLSRVFYTPGVVKQYADEYIQSDSFLINDSRHYNLAKMFVSRLEIVTRYLIERNKNSAFSDLAVEKVFSYIHPDDSDFIIFGKIDLIKILAKADMNYVIVIDYKTGTKQFSDEEFIKGLDIQLLFYLNLLVKSHAIRSIKPVGFFFQPINPGKITKSNDADPLAERLQLEGRLISDYEVAKLLGAQGQIRGVAYKNNGDFRSNKHLIEADKMNEYINVMNGFIDEAVSDIKRRNFSITPLPISANKSTSASCEYCKFQGICYLANSEDDSNQESFETEDEDDESN